MGTNGHASSSNCEQKSTLQYNSAKINSIITQNREEGGIWAGKKDSKRRDEGENAVRLGKNRGKEAGLNERRIE